VTGARRFVSSDGYEILVGRSSAGNDAITFKIARPSDVWLHAADYPGSHVVVRNRGRSDVPHRTIAEAAQLAAFYSDARDDALVDVRYTSRRFVAKPKNAPPGLVRLGRFKTIAVRPSADIDRAT
jgi:predicted ribosome quality control (RQC) complex YloA/Tae2 family protein